MNSASEKQPLNFKASSSCIHDFNAQHRIRTRKITKTVSKGNLTKAGDLQEKAENFVNSVKPIIEEIGPANVYREVVNKLIDGYGQYW